MSRACRWPSSGGRLRSCPLALARRPAWSGSSRARTRRLRTGRLGRPETKPGRPGGHQAPDDSSRCLRSRRPVPRGGRRRREGTRWFADIHATPQAYHAGPDAVIHRSAWKGYSRKLDFRFTEFLEAYPPFWSAWAFTPGLSLLEHLPSHLLHLAFGVHLHIPACARLLGYLVGYLIRLTFSVLVRISPRTRILGYPLCEVLVGGLGIHARPLQGHVLHHDLSGLRRLLCLLAYLLCYVIRRLHGLHGWHRLHGRHRLHGFQRVFPLAGQRARLDVAPLDPPLNLFGPARGIVCPRRDLFADLPIRPAHGLVDPALGLPCLPLLIAYAHLLCLPHWCGACRFRTYRHLASWAGMCPGTDQSGGKRQSGKTTKGNPWLRAALIEAAHAAGRTKNTYLSAQYRRLASRRGKKRAAVAVGHTILVIAYHLSTAALIWL